MNIRAKETMIKRSHRSILAYISLLDGLEKEYAFVLMEYLTHPPRVPIGLGPLRATMIRMRVISELSQEIFVL